MNTQTLTRYPLRRAGAFLGLVEGDHPRRRLSLANTARITISKTTAMVNAFMDALAKSPSIMVVFVPQNNHRVIAASRQRGAIGVVFGRVDASVSMRAPANHNHAGFAPGFQLFKPPG